jgi:hypothetical protein
MITNLSKAASLFLKTSQDPLAPVRNAIDTVLAQKVSPDMAQVKSISLIGNTVKIEMELTPAGGSITRSQLEGILVPAVKVVNPALQVSVVVSLSSEGKVAVFRKRLNIKLAQEMTSNIKATIEESIKGIPGSKLLEVSMSGTNVDAKIEVPQQHSFTAQQLSDTLTKAIQSVAPGSKVMALLSFSTAKTASFKKKADAQQDAQNVVIAALSGLQNIGLHSFVWQPETKHILVEVGKSMDSKITTQQISAFLTNKIQAVAPGFSVIATAKLTSAAA